MQAENARRAAEMLKQSGELARTAAEMFDGGAAEEVVQKRLEQAKNLAHSSMELLEQHDVPATKCKPSLLRRVAGAALLTGMALYSVPEWRRSVGDAVKVVVDTLRDAK